MSEIHINLHLNGEDSSLVMSALMMVRSMMEKGLDKAIEDGSLPLISMTRKHLGKIDKIIKDVTTSREYTSNSFDEDPDRIIKEAEAALNAIEELQFKKDASLKEEGQEWEDAGNKVVSLLDRFRNKK